MRKAFTLIEVLIVLGIVVILASLALPAIRGAISSAQRSQVLSNIKQLYTVVLNSSIEGESLWPGTNEFNAWATTLPPRIATNDVKAIFSGGGITASNFPPEKSAIYVYQVREHVNEDYIFASSHNWNASTPTTLDPEATPFGESGFVYITKGGRGAIGRQKDATNAINGQPSPLSGNPSP